ncbi:MAG: CRISPR-associated DxTHG motif protein [Paludibacteraceae bacterium]|nr:CRISPR-associated DxTHG motif protein [Paludibacteraceae bacterium]
MISTTTNDITHSINYLPI